MTKFSESPLNRWQVRVLDRTSLLVVECGRRCNIRTKGGHDEDYFLLPSSKETDEAFLRTLVQSRFARGMTVDSERRVFWKPNAKEARHYITNAGNGDRGRWSHVPRAYSA